MTPQEIAKNKRLLKAYGWTLAMYYVLEQVQGGVCAICGKPPKLVPLNVDHIHFKIQVKRCCSPIKGWVAIVPELERPAWYAKTKAQAIRWAREDALPHSVRGLLCAGRYQGCNRLLGRIDNLNWLKKTIDYLKDPPARKILL